MNIDDMSYKDIEQEEARVAAQKTMNYKNEEKAHGSIDDMSYKDIEQEEARVAAQKTMNYKNEEKAHGSIDDMSYKDIEQEEARIAAQKNSYKNVEYASGSYENADESTLSAMAANKQARAEEYRPSREYLMSLIDNLEIQNYDEFKAAVTGSMQLNKNMVDFVDGLCEKINSKAFELKNVDKNDKENIELIKQEIEKSIEVYERYMYELKENQWDFSNLSSMKISEETMDKLSQEQKRLDIQFDMPIPADLGEYYGGKFEREGKMFPGIGYMYEELNGNKPNWYGILNYKEGELTPSQRYKQKMIERIKSQREELAGKEDTLTKMKEERQQGGNEYGE